MNNGIPQKNIRSYWIADCQFYDEDGMGVAAYLLVDDDGCLCELDLWKAVNQRFSHYPVARISSETSQWINRSNGGEHALAFALRALALTQHHL